MHRLLTIAALAIFVLAAVARGQTTIELRAASTARPGEPVRLSDIAELTGPDTKRLGAVVVLTATAPATTTTLSRDDVKAAINNGHPSVNWARTLLRGGSITITFADPAPAAPAPVPAPAASPALPAPASPATPPEPATPFRTLLLRALADAAGVDPADAGIVIRSDTLSPADQQLLAQEFPAAWKTRIQVIGATPGGRTTIRIDAFEGDRVTVSRTLNIDVFVHREVLVVATPGGMSRDQVVTSTDIRFDPRTLNITESARTANVSPEAVINGVLRRRIDQGKPIFLADIAQANASSGRSSAANLRAPMVIKRGDDVTLCCLAGAVELKSKAKALSSARDGEVVQLQIDGSKKTVSARVKGPGHAVMSLDPK